MMIDTAVQVESSAAAPAYELRANTLSFTSTPKTVYLGVPELYDTQHDQKIPLFAKAVNSKAAWQILTADQQGIYELRHQDTQGNLQFHEKCALLPENFALRFIPVTRRIEVEQSGSAYISCESPFLTGISVTDTGRSIEFNSSDTPPNEVDLILRWAGKTERLILTVPFPAHDGNKLTQAAKTRHVHSIHEITNLTDAQSISDDKLRQLFIRHHLKQLCLNFVADDWNNLRDLQTDAPLINNELWIAASLDSRVLAALVLQLDSIFMQRFATELSVCWELIPLKDWLIIFTRYKNYLAQDREDLNVKSNLNKHIDKINALSPSLGIIAQLLKYHLCDVDDEELQFMQTEDALPLIAEQLEHEHQELNQRQANRQWLEFLREELTADWQTLPSQTQQLLNLGEAKHCHAVSLLPLLLAHFSLTKPLQQSNSTLVKLQQLKAFDEQWFTTAFTLALSFLSQQTDYIQSLQQDITIMINSDENDLLAEIEQQLALAHQETQGLEADLHNFKGNQAELDGLRAENVELISTIEQLGEIIQKRDDALKLLLGEVKNLNTKIREIRNELQAKSNG